MTLPAALEVLSITANRGKGVIETTRVNGNRVLYDMRNTTGGCRPSAQVHPHTFALFSLENTPRSAASLPIIQYLNVTGKQAPAPNSAEILSICGGILQKLRFSVRGRSQKTARWPIFQFTGNAAMSVSSPAPDPIWEKMVGGDLSQAEILFKRHREELFRFTCGQLGARRRSAQSDADDIVQECFTRMLQLAQRLCLLHQHIHTPALLTQLLAECTSPGSSHTPSKLSDLARWIKRILGDQFPKLPHCHPSNNCSAANSMDS